ncbi:hypothetical protein [Parvibaculum lavamentivorans]|uniref:hypothetical protein n=1 Tax=Parvibaculum lavamentivorans TaxID=256618 RepID=UPI0002D4E6AB|nr:hypothetical protein [Parvibaculum lavamentivorans]
MTLALTLTILAVSAVSAGFFIWLEKKPVEPGRIRLLPTTTLLFACIIVAVVMLVHLVTLMGGHTGR